MALLFGGSGGSRGSQPKNVVEFRAGKMTMKGTTVSPDKRKGLLYIYQAEDNLTHFCWKDRKTGTVEDDLILFPDDCEYKKVTQCKEGSRVYLLKFKSSNRKLFFWMQEPKADNDDDYVWKVNEALNNPGGSGSSSSSRGNGRSGMSSTPSEQDMQALLSSMSQSQLMQLIGGIGGMSDLGGGSGLLAQLSQLGSPPPGVGSPTAVGASNSSSGGTRTTETSSGNSTGGRTETLKVKTSEGTAESSNSKGNSGSSSSTPAIQLQDLQKILSSIQPTPAAVDLSGGVSSELIQRIVSNPKTVKKLAPLLPTFGGPQIDSVARPSDESSSSLSESRDVEDTLMSPQFHSAVRAFCTAFPSGQLGPLVSQFEMGKAAVEAAENGNLEAFVNAIQQEAGSQVTSGTRKTTDESEDMNVD